ncbi:unnamed protein product [Fusarium fujikuroi]|nr:unnamed protein product [Fusarium fujikuroi]
MQLYKTAIVIAFIAYDKETTGEVLRDGGARLIRLKYISIAVTQPAHQTLMDSYMFTDGTRYKIQVSRSAIPRGIVSADVILHPSPFCRDVVLTTAGTLSRSVGTTQRNQSRQIEWFNWSRL